MDDNGIASNPTPRLMTNEKMRVKIAELLGLTCKSCGGTGIRHKMGVEEYHSIRNSNKEWRESWPMDEPDVKCFHNELPNYPEDLNACAEFEKGLEYKVQPQYLWELKKIIMRTSDTQGASDFEVRHATPLQLCEAFLRVHGAYEETPA
jgi:hypothetical protein